MASKPRILMNAVHGVNAWTYINSGYYNAFKALGYPVALYNGHFNEWNSFKPDIYFGSREYSSYRIVDSKVKIIFHVNPLMSSLTGINENVAMLSLVNNIKPTLLWANCLPSALHHFDKWKQHGHKVAAVSLACDDTLFSYNDQPKQYDIGWVGGRWAYKAKNLDIYLNPLQNRYKCCFSGNGWPTRVGDNEVNNIFNKSKVCPAVSEPHTSHSGIDMPERIFKVSVTSACGIQDPVVGAEEFFEGNVLVAKNTANWFELIDKLIKDDKFRVEQAAKQRKYILAKHTYKNRIEQMMSYF